MHDDTVHLADQLPRLTPPERAQRKEQYLARWRDEMDALLELLEGKNEDLRRTKRIDPDSAEYGAVAILQHARYVAAADCCVRHLDTRSTAFPANSDESQSDFQYFPFAVAAAAIGTPAPPALTAQMLAENVDSTRFQLSCLVLQQVLGDELARFHLTKAAENSQESRQGPWQQKAFELLRLPIEEWEATFCSDYSAR